MATMSSEVYDAFRAAGVTEDTARKAAEAIAQPQTGLIALEGKVTTLTWMVATNITLTLLVLGRLILVH